MSDPLKPGSPVVKDTAPDDLSGSLDSHRQAPPPDPAMPSQQQADRTNDQMARQMEQRRLSRPERRSGAKSAVVPERRVVCARRRRIGLRSARFHPLVRLLTRSAWAIDTSARH
jgi:hypothetical protein